MANWRRITRIDRRIVYVLVLLSIMLPIAFPLGLPLPISGEAVKIHNFIEQLKPGDAVLHVSQLGIASFPESRGLLTAVLQHIWNRPGVGYVLVGTNPDDPMFLTGVINGLQNPQNKVYGKDWVNLGYLPGEEIAFAAVAKDIKGAVKADFSGNPLTRSPLLDKVNSAPDFALLVATPQGGQVEEIMRQFYTPYHMKIIMVGPAFTIPLAQPFYRAGQLVSVLGGLSGGAEYEKLMGIKGAEIAQMDSSRQGIRRPPLRSQKKLRQSVI